jgi:hypothetical protein
MGAVLTRILQEERPSRRAVLAAMPLLALGLPALPPAGAEDEIVIVDGWVLRRSDLARF